jgi:hypothetical protein
MAGVVKEECAEARSLQRAGSDRRQFSLDNVAMLDMRQL